MPLPGSQLYKNAVDEGWDLPEDYAGYSFHAYTTKPIPTMDLTPEQILKFRDEAFRDYHTWQPFLEKVQKIKPHSGQQDSADNIYRLLQESEIHNEKFSL